MEAIHKSHAIKASLEELYQVGSHTVLGKTHVIPATTQHLHLLQIIMSISGILDSSSPPPTLFGGSILSHYNGWIDRVRKTADTPVIEPDTDLFK